MIVGAQMRAARAALNWSIEDLAEKSGVSARTIMRFEAVDGVPPGRTQLGDQAASEQRKRVVPGTHHDFSLVGNRNLIVTAAGNDGAFAVDGDVKVMTAWNADVCTGHKAP